MTSKETVNLRKRVEFALDEIRPYLLVDGGDIEIVDIINGKELIMKWLGNCDGCNMSVFTLKSGVEETIRMHVPEIQAIRMINSKIS